MQFTCVEIKMKTRYKIAIIVALIPVVVIGGQVVLLVGSIQVGGFLVGLVSNEDFDEEMRQLDEAKLFHEKYGISTVGHSSDIIAWKEIHYGTKSSDGNQAAELFIKKNMLHGNIKLQFSCIYDIRSHQEYHSNYELYRNGNLTEYGFDDSEFALYLVDQEKILDHLKNKHCFSGERD
ncbi:hypothetical protein [Nitrosopumilus sp.]|uniref:hypothetical protein n=1 Tax=Nitrosopumilus sp. TaxID=2024843 RepID=UPI003B5A2921